MRWCRRWPTACCCAASQTARSYRGPLRDQFRIRRTQPVGWHHLTEAGLTGEAIAFWYKSRAAASERSAHVEAIAHLPRPELLATPRTLERDRQELQLQLPSARVDGDQSTPRRKWSGLILGRGSWRGGLMILRYWQPLGLGSGTARLRLAGRVLRRNYSRSPARCPTRYCSCRPTTPNGRRCYACRSARLLAHPSRASSLQRRHTPRPQFGTGHDLGLAAAITGPWCPVLALPIRRWGWSASGRLEPRLKHAVTWLSFVPAACVIIRRDPPRPSGVRRKQCPVRGNGIGPQYVRPRGSPWLGHVGGGQTDQGWRRFGGIAGLMLGLCSAERTCCPCSPRLAAERPK